MTGHVKCLFTNFIQRIVKNISKGFIEISLYTYVFVYIYVNKFICRELGMEFRQTREVVFVIVNFYKKRN